MTLTLGGKTYRIEKVPIRAVAEMDKAWEMYRRLVRAATDDTAEENSTGFAEVIEALAEWMVILFGRQFTLDELMDQYPSESFLSDAGLIMHAVLGRVTHKLEDFPTQARATPETAAGAPLPFKSTRYFWTRGVRRRKSGTVTS